MRMGVARSARLQTLRCVENNADAVRERVVRLREEMKRTVREECQEALGQGTKHACRFVGLGTVAHRSSTLAHLSCFVEVARRDDLRAEPMGYAAASKSTPQSTHRMARSRLAAMAAVSFSARPAGSGAREACGYFAALAFASSRPRASTRGERLAAERLLARL
jgi:hypothetical protein